MHSVTISVVVLSVATFVERMHLVKSHTISAVVISVGTFC